MLTSLNLIEILMQKPHLQFLYALRTCLTVTRTGIFASFLPKLGKILFFVQVHFSWPREYPKTFCIKSKQIRWRIQWNKWKWDLGIQSP